MEFRTSYKISTNILL